MQNHPSNEIAVPASTSVPAPAQTFYALEEEQEVHLRDYWHILAKRKRWVIGVFSGVMAATLLVILLMAPVYRVTTTLQIIQDNPSAIMGGSSTDPLGALTGSSELDRFYETQYNILQSRAIAYGLIDSLNLKEHPSYKEIEADNRDDPPEVVRQKYAQFLLENLKVEPVKNSYLVNVSFKSTDKKLAQKLPEAIQGEYLKLSMTTRQQSYTLLRQWLEDELTRLGKKLEISERSVYADGRNHDFLSLEEGQYNVIVQKYVEVSKALTVAQSERAIKEAQFRQISEKGADAPLITNHPLVTQLRQQLIDLQGQVTGSGQIFGSNYPEHKGQSARMSELRERLGQEVRRIEASVRADYEAALRAENLLQKEFDLQKEKVIDLQNGLVQHHILKRDLQTNQTLYEGLLARMKEASIASTMVASNVSVVNTAETPYKPWVPKPLLFLGLAAVIGALLGTMTAFFVEYLDSSIKNTEELERNCRIPVLGVVPLADAGEVRAQGNHVDLIAHYKPMSMVGEAVFQIRSAIMLSVSGAPPQSIVVTSANPMEGKTFVAANIAVALAGNDRRCVIVDCDLRKPRLHKVFEQDNRVGLSSHLTGHADLEKIVLPTEIPNLFFIPAGPLPPNPNELFASTAFESLVRRLRQDFSHIVIDSPPVIGFADARSLAVHADGAVLVFRHHCTTGEAGRLAVQLMTQNHCHILGGILSMARRDLMGPGAYYGYYRHYHRYYGGYRSEGENGSGAKSEHAG